MPESKSNSPLNAWQCMRTAVELEQRADRFYRALSQRLAGIGWLSKLLQGLADEEVQHALRIQLLVRAVPRLAWPEEELVRVSAELQRGIARIDESDARFAALPEIAPDMLLAEIDEIESLFRSVHVEMMARSASAPVRALFDALATQDQAHRDLARRAREQTGRA